MDTEHKTAPTNLVRIDPVQLKTLAALMRSALFDMEPDHTVLALVVVTVPNEWRDLDENSPSLVSCVQCYVKDEVDNPNACGELGRLIVNALQANARPFPPDVTVH